MKLEIAYVDNNNENQTVIIELPSDGLEHIENFLIEQLGYYPNSVDVKRI